MRHAAPVRRELGIRTLFNLLGPLSNPASATHQVVGVYDSTRVEQLARALGALGLTAAWVVHGAGGLDEVSTSGPTTVAQLMDGEVTTFEVTPGDFGLSEAPIEALRGGDAQRNAAIIAGVLAGDPRAGAGRRRAQRSRGALCRRARQRPQGRSRASGRGDRQRYG